jgi:uncharacterized membrane protein YhaH (DUF805 family)
MEDPVGGSQAGAHASPFRLMFLLALLPLILPSLSVLVRRHHDNWTLRGLVLHDLRAFRQVRLLAFTLMRGDAAANLFGPPPD